MECLNRKILLDIFSYINQLDLYLMKLVNKFIYNFIKKEKLIYSLDLAYEFSIILNDKKKRKKKIPLKKEGYSYLNLVRDLYFCSFKPFCNIKYNIYELLDSRYSNLWYLTDYNELQCKILLILLYNNRYERYNIDCVRSCELLLEENDNLKKFYLNYKSLNVYKIIIIQKLYLEDTMKHTIIMLKLYKLALERNSIEELIMDIDSITEIIQCETKHENDVYYDMNHVVYNQGLYKLIYKNESYKSMKTTDLEKILYAANYFHKKNYDDMNSFMKVFLSFFEEYEQQIRYCKDYVF